MKKFTAALVAFSFLVAPLAQAQAANGPKPQPPHQSQMQAPKPGKPGAPAPAKPGTPPKPGAQAKPGTPPKPGAQRPGQPHVKPAPVRPAKPMWKPGHRYGDWRKHPPVRDYHRYGLRRPAPGQQWIRIGNYFLLVGVTTGIIASIVAASR